MRFSTKRLSYDTHTRWRWHARACRLNVIQRQLGHADLGVTSVYLQGIDNTEVVSTVNARSAPTMPASAGLLI